MRYRQKRKKTDASFIVKKETKDLKHLQKYSTLQESAISLTAEKNIQERFRS